MFFGLHGKLLDEMPPNFRVCRIGILTGIILLPTCATHGVAREVHISLEITTSSDAPLTAAQDWLTVLKESEVDQLRLRVGRKSDAPRQEVRTAGDADAIHVTGVIDRKNLLRLPGQTFRLSDKKRLLEWIQAQKQGIEKVDSTTSTGRMGLTQGQLAAFKLHFAKTKSHATKNREVAHCIHDLFTRTKVIANLDEAARRRLNEGSLVPLELEGISSGTALAILLNHMELGFIPDSRVNGGVTLSIRPSVGERDLWPIGWSPIDKTAELVPKIYATLSVEMDKTPLTDSLAAVQGRLNVPLLIDRPAMNRAQMDPDQLLISLPSSRSSYKRIIDRIASRARLKSELRIDEDGRPFFWLEPRVSSKPRQLAH